MFKCYSYTAQKLGLAINSYRSSYIASLHASCSDACLAIYVHKVAETKGQLYFI